MIRPAIHFALALLLAASAPALAVVGQGKRAQTPQYQQQPVTQADGGAVGVLVSSDEDYKIGSSDIVEIRVDDAPELSGLFRVSASGLVAMPFLGRVAVAGKTADEVSDEIAGRLRGRYLMNPNVLVAVRQVNSRAFFVQGAVHRPGVYQIEGRPSLLRLITVAGGLSENHGSSAFIIRENKQPPSDAAAPAAATAKAEGNARYTLLSANINGLLKGRFDQNLPVEPGDIVNIPPTDVFFVSGEVNAPGSFPLKDGTTLQQALSLAQGATFKGSLKDGLIFREDPSTGKREEIRADFAAVMGGKKEDIVIKPNDVIMVPNSKFKSAMAPILNAFGYGASVAAGGRVIR